MRPAKGKAKAVNDPTERDPLLAASSQSHPHPPDRGILPQPSRLRSILVIILVITFSVILSFVLLIALLAASFRPSPSELSSLPSTAFKYAPPDSVTVLNVTDSGIWLNITVRCGIDADAALGVRGFTSAKEREFAEIHGERGIGSQWWESMRRWVAHRALDSLPQRSIRVSLPDPIHVFPRHFTSPPLLSLLVDQLDIPLVSGVPPVASPERPQWLQATSVIAFARPIASTGELWAFVQRSWIEGSVQVVVSTPLALARVPQSPWWAQFAQVNESDLIMELALPVPHVPGLPVPGHPLDLSSIMTLRHYSLKTVNSTLAISARATIPNILPGIDATVPFALPFAICLDSFSTMAHVVTDPVHFGGADLIDLTMSGQVLADLSDSRRDSPLSVFIRNYLRGLDNPVIVQGLSALPSGISPLPPRWLLESLPSFSVPLIFPGPQPPPKIIQSISIEHMRISESGGKMRASGTVIAEVELPRDLQAVQIDVVAVLPDVLIFDGPAPEDDRDDDGDYPPRAFGHIHPDDYLPAITSPSENVPYCLIVRAPLDDVPLDVLPGRDGVLSSFVSKVIFKGGADAGIRGVTSVRTTLTGVKGGMRLDELPVTGLCWVGRR